MYFLFDIAFQIFFCANIPRLLIRLSFKIELAIVIIPEATNYEITPVEFQSLFRRAILDPIEKDIWSRPPGIS